jgi:hypothetical protein
VIQHVLQFTLNKFSILNGNNIHAVFGYHKKLNILKYHDIRAISKNQTNILTKTGLKC